MNIHYGVYRAATDVFGRHDCVAAVKVDTLLTDAWCVLRFAWISRRERRGAGNAGILFREGGVGSGHV